MLVSILLLGAVISGQAEVVRVATIQFESIDGAFQKNLHTATNLVRDARDRGAQVVLLPEFALIGYDLSSNIWRSGETRNGTTISSLSELAAENKIYLGTTFLEVDGEHFYNTFALLGPEGQLLGTVRKRKPAGAEGYFFRGDRNDHVIETALGNIGVGICQENYRCFLPTELHEVSADLVLMPFSYPDLSKSGGLGSPKGSYIASWYASQLGIPVVTSNKTGVWPQVEGAYFPGYSAIAEADGRILGELDMNPGVLVMDVSLDPKLKVAPKMDCVGPFVRELTLGSWLDRRLTWAMIWVSEVLGYSPESEIEQSYLESEDRRDAALLLQ